MTHFGPFRVKNERKSHKTDTILQEMSIMAVLTEGQINTAKHEMCKKRVRGQRIRRSLKRDLKRLFLRQFAHNGNVSQTCRELLVARNTVYQWLQDDEDFAERYQSLVNKFYPPLQESVSLLSLEELVARMSSHDLARLAKRWCC
jgi:hypothetical protein